MLLDTICSRLSHSAFISVLSSGTLSQHRIGYCATERNIISSNKHKHCTRPNGVPDSIAAHKFYQFRTCGDRF